MKKLLLATTLLLSAYAMGQTHAIGHTTITFQDPNRGNRSIETEIYYPATTAGNNTTAVNGQFPVIVFGHGFVMAWSAYANLWEDFVPRGYIMVFPRTEGNAFSTDHQKFGWDLQFLVTEMQNEGNRPASILFNRVAPETALMGHSMGGGAAFLAADSLCSNGNTNLKTLIGFAPAESTSNGVSSIASALNVTVPSIVLSGIQDGVAPPASNHDLMYANLASDCKSSIHIIGGAHCYFANSNVACDFGEGTSSSGISISRLEQQDITSDFVNLWLEYTLKGNCNSLNSFNDSIANSLRANSEQVCTITPAISTTQSATICQGDTYTFPDGTTSSSATTHTSNLFSVFGCDSNIVTTLSVTGIDTTVTQSNNILSANQIGASYQWINCADSSPIAGETNATFGPQTYGSYAVEITLNGCMMSSSCHIVQVLGLNDVTNDDNLLIYPNPSNGSITIGLTTSTEFILYDTKQSIVYRSFLSPGNHQIDLHLTPGIYFWKSIDKERASEVGKLIIQ